MNTGAASASALLLGMSGAAHCALMCGPLNACVSSAAGRARLHFGRALSYLSLGALVGGFGAGVAAHVTVDVAAQASRALIALTLFLTGLRLFGAGKWLSRSIPESPRITRWMRSVWVNGRSTTSFALRGLVWGFLPCGLVYAALALAASTGSVLGGVVVMGSFALATMPVFALLVVFSSRLRGAFQRPLVQRTAGLLLLLGGLVHLSFLARERGLVIGSERSCCRGRQ
jgi:uncharacterized protein